MEDLAVVGLGCRFPAGANSPEEFWRLLRKGYDGLGSEFAAESFHYSSITLAQQSPMSPLTDGTLTSGTMRRAPSWPAKC